ncbi:hypothetical protein GALL_107520 [mine drainage metagenome]|uniref:Uncharacterized protein n=1 Tax=mine drainage metagenome TaxID=410659 RepID=A0A1J5SGX4_9ZZZZ
MAERETPAQEEVPPHVTLDLAAAGHGAGADHRERRRRLLKAGAAAAPAVITLFSRPALGWTSTNQCKTPSGFLSGNLSQHGKDQYCSGVTPGYWKQDQHFCDWPAPYYPTTVTGIGIGGHHATKFHPLFAGSFFVVNGHSETLLEVLQNSAGGGTYALGCHIAATLLNSAKGWTSVLSVTQVINIWAEFDSKGYFEPSAGIKWYADDIVTYLKSTMT